MVLYENMKQFSTAELDDKPISLAQCKLDKKC